MYGLRIGVDLSFFVGRTLSQVCIGANELILNFDSDVSVTVESRVGMTVPGQVIERVDDLRSSAAFLVHLIERQIETVSGGREGTLRLQFTTGHILEIYDTSQAYESYQIRNGPDVIVV